MAASAAASVKAVERPCAKDVGFAVGIVMNLIQVATSLQDSAFSTFPRLAAFLGGFVLLMPWMLNKLTSYTAAVFTDIAKYGH